MRSTGSVLGGDHSDDVDISSPEPTVKRRYLLWVTVHDRRDATGNLLSARCRNGDDVEDTNGISSQRTIIPTTVNAVPPALSTFET
jgi:hypothetical protein